MSQSHCGGSEHSSARHDGLCGKGKMVRAVHVSVPQLISSRRDAWKAECEKTKTKEKAYTEYVKRLLKVVAPTLSA